MKKELLLLMMILLPMVASADAVEIDGIYYNLIHEVKIAEVTRNPNGYTGNVVIPESVTYEGTDYSVTSIGNHAFAYCSSLTSVIIGNSVTSIGGAAFQDCSGLTSVNIPNSVTIIDDNAFWGCTKLNTIISERIDPIAIKKTVFSPTTYSTTTLIIPAFTKSFYQTTDFWNNFTNIVEHEPIERTIHISTAGTLADRISEAEKYTIDKLVLTGEINGADLRLIRDMAGNNGRDTEGKLKVLDLSGVELKVSPEPIVNSNSIEWRPVKKYLSGAISLNGTLFISDSHSLPGCTFVGCTSLVSVSLPDNLTSIEGHVFLGCGNLTTINIPSTVEYWGDDNYTGGLERTNWYENQPDGIVYLGNILYKYKGTMPENTIIKIKEGTKGIASNAFSGCTGLTSVTIPNSVSTIGRAFYNCTNLKTITIPESVYRIDYSAFGNTAWYDEQPEGPIYAGNVLYDYKGENAPININVKEGTLGIGGGDFKACKTTESINIPSSTRYIGFAGGSSLQSINVDSNNEHYKSISGVLFSKDGSKLIRYPRNKSESSYSIPSGVKYIMRSVFSNCDNLESIIAPKSVVAIDGGSFYGCSKLSSIQLQDGLRYISYDVFFDSPELTDVYCHAEIVPNANPDAFRYSNIENATLHVPAVSVNAYKTAEPWKNFGTIQEIVDDIPKQYAVLDDSKITLYYDTEMSHRSGTVLPNKDEWSNYKDQITECVIDPSFANLKLNSLNSFFYEWSQLKSIEGLENLNTSNVTNMRSMFYGCSSLTSLDVSEFKTDNVTNMGSMFRGCSSLTTLDVSGFKTDNVTNMGSMFRDCSSLTSLDLSVFKTDNVTSMSLMFYGCSSLTSLDVSGFKTDNVTDMSWMFSGCSSLTSLDVSGFKTDNVTDMGSMFSGCSSLTCLDVSGFKTDNVTNMYSMFDGCSSLTSLDVSGFKTDNVMDMYWMFSGCSNLTNLDVSGFKTDNMDYMFYCCSGLTSITIPNSVTNIGSSAFEGCSGLTSVTIPNSVTSIGEAAFFDCSGLTSVTIPSSVTSIGVVAFSDCSNLTSVTIPNSVTSIGSGAFEDCSALTSVTIGSGIESIEYKAFASCPELTDVYCYANIVPNTETNVFNYSPIETATLHVPAESVDAYKNAEPWKNFGTIQEIVEGKVKLSKTKAVIEKGKTMTLKAKVYPTALDQSVTWESSDPTIVKVASTGKIKGLKVGTATITCTSNATGAKATCKVTVGYVKLSNTEVAIEKGKTLTLKSKVYPTTLDQSVTWKSSNTAIVTVTSKGKVKGLRAGTAIITCTSNATGLSTICEVTVGYVKLNYTELTIANGKTKTLKSKVYPTTEDQSVTWKSSNPTIVKVASSGKIKGLKAGTAIVTCISNATGLSTTCKVTVVKASAAPSLDGTDEDVTGIDEKAALAEEFDVYDLNGRRVLNKATSLDGLSNGVYIVNGKKVLRQ